MRLLLAIAIYCLIFSCRANDVKAEQLPAYAGAPKPVYPSESRRAGEEGAVMVRALINEAGDVDGVRVQKSSGFSRLDESALAAVAKAKFRPYSPNGVATKVYALIPIKFALDPPEPPKPSQSENVIP